MKHFKGYVLLILILLGFSANHAQEASSEVIRVETILQLKGMYLPKPVFSDKGKSEFKASDLLDFENFELSSFWPSEGEQVQVNNEKKLSWEKISNQENSFQLRNEKRENFYEVAYLAFYIQTERWLETKLNLSSCQMLNVYLNGETLLKKSEVQKDNECEKGEVSKVLKLEQGKYLIIIKTIYDENSKSDWNINAELTVDAPFTKNDLKVSISPEYFTTVRDLLDNPKIDDVSISADGEVAAIEVSKRNKAKDADEKWTEFYLTESGKLLQSLRGEAKKLSPDWGPAGKKYGFRTSGTSGSTLWIADLEKGTSEPVIEDIENLGGFEWAPDGQSIIYSVYETEKPADTDITFINKPQDRVPGSTSKSYIYKLNLIDRSRSRLTAGELSTGFQSITSDGKKLVFTMGKTSFDERPFEETEYYVLNLETMNADSLFSIKFGGDCQFSPDAKKLLIMAGPSSFGSIGMSIPEDQIPNDYDTQAYLYDIASGKVEAITKDFNPKIESAFWDKNSGKIYFVTTDRSYRHLYSYNLNSKNFTKVDLKVEYVHNIKFSNNSSYAVFSGSSSNTHEKVYTYNMKTNDVELLKDVDPNYKNIKMGDVKDFSFATVDGTNILGRVYYPPDFDKAKMYPAIVYYYAGTSPVTREFEGRYPKNIWAANGYVVYVLQPRGASGFGQRFSAFHVNDWGEETAKDIIKGTQEFLKAHPFVDSKRLGCIGASYGGFMTMNLITKTDMFAAAVSHAGISALTSYWGAGYWGMVYSTVATADSYPWNRKDIYVDKSPIYSADKITTPLLLLHGASDTNVPTGESYQMFAALKVLNKDVTLITIPELDHHIMEYTKRKKWTKTIISYFDKYLKDQPEWWNDLYGEK